MVDVSNYILRLRNYIEGNNFAGYDPYDALNSPILRRLTFGHKYARIAWIQLMRRLPVNLRPLLLVPKGHNPKGLGLFLWGYVRLHKLDPRPEYMDQINLLLELLSKTVSRGYSGSCWGYNFDWENRAFYIPKYTPTVVNTSFIGHALLDGWELLGDRRFLELAVSTRDFLVKDLNRNYEADTFCFSYTPIDRTWVHNANLLGASLLIRLYNISGEKQLKECATQSLAYSMKYQHKDGSWFYAESDFQRWVDSFHTGFNLEAIRYFLRLGEAVEYKAAYKKGVHYYASHFFLQDGTPKYYSDQVYPIDIHCPAQAIAFFSGEGDEYKGLTDRIMRWMLENMWSPQGYFYFRKGRYFTNRIPYMRWSQAWAFHAITAYLNNISIFDG